MTQLLTAAQMRAAEEKAIRSGEVTGLELMERAGTGVVDAIFAEWPDLGARRAVVLCGPGNNGGDGYVIARLLHNRGWVVHLFSFGDAERLPPDAARNRQSWTGIGAVGNISDLASGLQGFLDSLPEKPSLYIDALFGTGLTRPLPKIFCNGWFSILNSAAFESARRARCGAKVVAVDVPSGLCSDSGRVLGIEDDAAGPPKTALADLTVTFHSPKPGHYLADGPVVCGKLVCKDIGLDPSQSEASIARLVEPENFASAADISPLSKARPRTLSKASKSHKYSHGHAVILSGPPGQGGAARLAARAALRIGAGLVTVGCPLRAVAEHAARLDAIMVRSVDGAEGLATILEDRRLNAICLGPGLGLGPSTSELVKVVLAARRATVLDADALTRFQRDPRVLFDLLHDKCVLTPHAGEFSRLFPDLAEKLDGPATSGPAFSKIDAVREAARRAGCVVLLKGPDTVIADSDGTCSVSSAAYGRETPWLATAGAGDVLAGMITGLLARGFTPRQAAETGAWLHVECAGRFGPGLIAEDLPDMLPGVFRDLGL